MPEETPDISVTLTLSWPADQAPAVALCNITSKEHWDQVLTIDDWELKADELFIHADDLTGTEALIDRLTHAYNNGVVVQGWIRDYAEPYSGTLHIGGDPESNSGVLVYEPEHVSPLDIARLCGVTQANHANNYHVHAAARRFTRNLQTGH